MTDPEKTPTAEPILTDDALGEDDDSPHVGRPTNLTDKLLQDLCILLRAGNYIEAACDYVGLPTATFYEWMRRGEGKDKTRKHNQIYYEFAIAIRKARSRAEMDSVKRIRDSAQSGNWQADAWFLERSYPSRWGRQRHEIGGFDGAPIQVGVDANVTVGGAINVTNQKARDILADQTATDTMHKLIEQMMNKEIADSLVPQKAADGEESPEGE